MNSAIYFLKNRNKPETKFDETRVEVSLILILSSAKS